MAHMSGVGDGTSTRTEADGSNRRRARRLGELELQRSGSQEGSHHVGCCASEDCRCTTSKVGESEGEEEIVAREFPDEADCDRRNFSSWAPV